MDMKNPIVYNDKKLREVLVMKRNCHKAFDSIKCNEY